MSSKQARDAETNKARRVAARRERASKRMSTATRPPATIPVSSVPKKSNPPVVTEPVNDVAFELEDRDGRLAIFLTVCSMALMALLIIAVLKAA